MNGLDLETLLILLKADLRAWAVLGLIGGALALLAWSSWSSRRVLRRCLAMSLAVHLGLVLYGSTVPAVRKIVRGGTSDPSEGEHIRRIRVAPLSGPGGATPGAGTGGAMKGSPAGSLLELSPATPPLVDSPLRVERPPVARLDGMASKPAPPVELAAVTPDLVSSEPPPATPRPEVDPSANGPPPAPPAPAPPDMAEVDRTPDEPPSPTPGREEHPSKPDGAATIERAVGAADLALRRDVRLRPGRSASSRPSGDRPAPAPSSTSTGRSTAVAPGSSTAREAGLPSGGMPPDLRPSAARPAGADAGPLAMEHVTPRGRPESPAGPGLADLGDRPAARAPADVPKVYRSRVEPDRSARARLAGASAASERAVERALDWLARHQDRDGRWNAAVGRQASGIPVPGDRDFTAHCPAGEVCSGPCAYWEADTALTGLALLTYLGAGHTHLDGRHAETVGRGLSFLIRQQKADGDLRGPSVVVGMYGHAMATLALCEGYALTGDDRLRGPAERAVAFLVRARAVDRESWRYRPGEPIGDTSILGWVVMGLKSAREARIPIPEESSMRSGAIAWLDRVASGPARGLACYQPGDKETPTMTAEAWVCRQFLDVGGPGPASTEAAEFLLRHESDRGGTNFYYWYYATLALFQDGGEPWTRWNAATRDRIVGLQHDSGHKAGSWDPDESLYGSKGGRIYCTALAALTLEVYYRYLRLYDGAGHPLESGEAPALAPPAREPEPPAPAPPQSS